jgi:hypothetical protein
MPVGIETKPPGAKLRSLSTSSLSPMPAERLPEMTVTFSVVG